MKSKIQNFLSKFLKPKIIGIPEIVNVDSLLKDRVAIITGGSGGIGFEIANKFVNSGASVILIGRDEKKLKNNCNALGEKASYFLMDVTDFSNLKSNINQLMLLNELSTPDILVNSAGVLTYQTFGNISMDEYDKVRRL